MNEFFGALLATAVAALVSYFISNRDLSDSLDSKSGWRAKLFDVASKYELTLDDAQTVRAALRIFPQRKKVEQYSFTWFSNAMIDYLDNYVLNRKFTSEVLEKNTVINEKNTDIIRLFAMFLLKYHFEYRSSMGAKEYVFFDKKPKNRKANSLVKEVYAEYVKLLEEK